MQVTDEVQNVFECRHLLFQISSRVCELRRELLNLVDNTVVRWTIGGCGAGRDFAMIEARFVKIRRDNLDVNEMPLPCLLSRTVDVGIPVLVCPSRL